MTRPEAEEQARKATELAFRLGYRGHAYFVVRSPEGTDFQVRRQRPSDDSGWSVVRVFAKERHLRFPDPLSFFPPPFSPPLLDGD